MAPAPPRHRWDTLAWGWQPPGPGGSGGGDTEVTHWRSQGFSRGGSETGTGRRWGRWWHLPPRRARSRMESRREGGRARGVGSSGMFWDKGSKDPGPWRARSSGMGCARWECRVEELGSGSCREALPGSGGSEQTQPGGSINPRLPRLLKMQKFGFFLLVGNQSSAVSPQSPALQRPKLSPGGSGGWGGFFFVVVFHVIFSSFSSLAVL